MQLEMINDCPCPGSYDYAPNSDNEDFPKYSSHSYFEKHSEKKSLNNNNSNKELLQNKEKKEENPLKKEFEKLSKQLFNQNQKNNDNMYDFDKRLYNLENDQNVLPVNIFNAENNLDEDEDEESENKSKENNYNTKPINNNNNSNIIYNKEDEKNINLNINQSSTYFTCFKYQNNSIEENNHNSENIQYKKESAQKKIKAHILKSNLKKLNKLIKLYLPQKFNRRSNKIHTANYSITKNVTNIGNKKFMNMKFRKILIYGKN